MASKTDKPTCFICYTVKGFGLPMAGHKDNHAGLMTPAQMDTFREANNVRPGHEWDKFEGLAHAEGRRGVPQARAVRGRRRAPAEGAGDPGAGDPAAAAAGQQLDAGRLRRHPQRHRPRRRRLHPAHRHRLARRHRLDQSRRLGQPARPVRARGDAGHLPQRAHPLDLQLGRSRRRASTSSSASRKPTCSSCCRRSACRTRSTACGCCRSARSTIPSSRAASISSTTPATRTPASWWWGRRRASRWRPKAARISRSPSR